MAFKSQALARQTNNREERALRHMKRMHLQAMKIPAVPRGTARKLARVGKQRAVMA